MKTASISEAKNCLSALLARVRHGETIVITDRNVPIARIEPMSTTSAGDDEGRLSRLERAGVIRRGRSANIERLWKERPALARKGGDVLAALLAERESGR